MIKLISKYTLILLLTIFFISCSDDDNDNNSPTGPGDIGEVDNALVGTWVLSKILSPIATTPDVAGIFLTAIFNDDGTMQLTTVDDEGTSVDLGTWGTSNGNITIALEGEDPVTSSYNVDGDVATISNFEVEFQGSTVLASLEFVKLP
ncbi:MAG: hypothetical protein R3250_00905 [Melioribacteraceae bacterium]|nr:hypothetical protein [Melioribacteraceae bacterium]